MPDKSAAQRLRESAGSFTSEESDKHPWRRAFDVDPQPTGMAFSLYVESKDERQRTAAPWALYNGLDWADDGRDEVLQLLFSNRLVIVTGVHLKQALRSVEACRVRGIREHNSVEQKAIEQWNNEHSNQLEPMVKSVKFMPETFQEVVDSTLNRMAVPDDPYSNLPH